MLEHADRTRMHVIDASTPTFLPSSKELHPFLREHFTSRGFPDYEMDRYRTPGSKYASEFDVTTTSMKPPISASGTEFPASWVQRRLGWKAPPPSRSPWTSCHATTCTGQAAVACTDRTWQTSRRYR